MKRIILAVLVLYVGAYAVFRTVNAAPYPFFGKTYVIYPHDQRWLYVLFRPMAYADDWLTGMGAYIGPHTDPDGN